MAEIIRKFTTPDNTEIIFDSAAPQSTSSKPVHKKVTFQAPSINGNNNYIWSPYNDFGQTITFRSEFFLEGLPLQSPALPICVFYTYVAIETAAISAAFYFIDVLGRVVQKIPLFTYSIDGNYYSVETYSAEAYLKPNNIYGNSVCLTIDATITTPVTPPITKFSGYYLGEVTAHALTVNKK